MDRGNKPTRASWKNYDRKYVVQAAEIMKDLSVRELEVMTILAEIRR